MQKNRISQKERLFRALSRFEENFESFLIFLEKISQPAITCSKLAIETLEQGPRRHFGDFIVNFEHI